MRKCPRRMWRLASVDALVERWRELVHLVREAGAPAVCYERAAMRVQRDIFQAPEIETFDLIDELTSMEHFLREVRRRMGAKRFDLWWVLRAWELKPAAAVEQGVSPWSVSTLYERIRDGFVDEVDAEVCTALIRAGWYDFDARLLDAARRA